MIIYLLQIIIMLIKLAPSYMQELYSTRECILPHTRRQFQSQMASDLIRQIRNQQQKQASRTKVNFAHSPAVYSRPPCTNLSQAMTRDLPAAHCHFEGMTPGTSHLTLLPAPKSSLPRVSCISFTWYYTDLAGVCAKFIRGCFENCTHLLTEISLFYSMMVLPECPHQLQLWGSTQSSEHSPGLREWAGSVRTLV